LHLREEPVHLVASVRALGRGVRRQHAYKTSSSTAGKGRGLALRARSASLRGQRAPPRVVRLECQLRRCSDRSSACRPRDGCGVDRARALALSRDVLEHRRTRNPLAKQRLFGKAPPGGESAAARVGRDPGRLQQRSTRCAASPVRRCASDEANQRLASARSWSPGRAVRARGEQLRGLAGARTSSARARAQRVAGRSCELSTATVANRHANASSPNSSASLPLQRFERLRGPEMHPCRRVPRDPRKVWLISACAKRDRRRGPTDSTKQRRRTLAPRANQAT